MRLLSTLFVCALLASSTIADDRSNDRYVMNFDLITKTADGDDKYNINLKGIHLPDNKTLHGDDLGEFEYFFTVSGTDNRNGKLLIEFYEYESRSRISEVVSEILSEVNFEFGIPGRFQSRNERFGIDLAFSIDQL